MSLVTIIKSHIHIPYYYKLTEQQFGAAQICLATIAVLSKHTIKVASNKLPIILKYCSLLLDSCNAQKKCQHYLSGPTACALLS